MKHVRTKMICTIGPAVRSPEMIEKLIDAGMNVARLNFSHGTHGEHKEVIDWLKAARKKMKVPLAIMLDTKGPEIRVGSIENNAVQLSSGQELVLTEEALEGNGERITVHPPHIISHLKVGMDVLFDDGYITAKVVKTGKGTATLKIENTAILKTNKGVNIPSGDIPLPHVTEQDIKDIAFGCKEKVDFIAASFVQSADTVIAIHDILEEHKGSDIKIIAKIESAGGVKNFENILQVADGIMVARGDLGVELPLSQVPQLQKMMIRKSYNHSKMVVTATQMLESMIGNSRPTRAEASDVA
ncbi:MAG: pyruvate kinase, partial [Simkaniaceae bacterium]|nr:pyruvate kinase [Simkaniaceae bacterium]